MTDHSALNPKVRTNPKTGEREFASIIGGHVALLTLLKRWRFLRTRLEPRTIDEGWEDSWGELWPRLSRKVLGRVLRMPEATGRDLLLLAQAVGRGIEKLPARGDFYPRGWQDVMRSIGGGDDIEDKTD